MYLGVGTNEGGESVCEPGPVPTLADTSHGIGSMVYAMLRVAEFLRVAGVDAESTRSLQTAFRRRSRARMESRTISLVRSIGWPRDPPLCSETRVCLQ